MEKKKSKKGLLFIIIAVILIVAAVIIAVVLMSGHRVIKVDDMDGEVSLERDSSEKDIVEGMNLKSKDMVTTGDDGLLELLVDTDKHILAKQNTCFEIVSNGNEKKGKLKIKLEYGSSLIEIENKLNDNSSVEVETPNASLSVRGTTFEVRYSKEDKSTFVEVTDGVVEVKAGEETKRIKEGQIANVSEEGVVVVDKELLHSEVPDFEEGSLVEEEEQEDEQEEEDSFDIENVEPGTIVSQGDVPKIFRNEITFDELKFMLRVLEGARVTPRFDVVNTGINMVWYEPELAGVYSPMEGTAYDYDVDMLNRLFSVFTSIKISEDKIPSYAALNGDVLTLEPCTLEDHGEVTISIYTFCFTDDNQILLEYEYVRTNDSTGSSGVKGNSCVVFVPDENGKYRYEYSMEYGSNPF